MTTNTTSDRVSPLFRSEQHVFQLADIIRTERNSDGNLDVYLHTLKDSVLGAVTLTKKDGDSLLDKWEQWMVTPAEDDTTTTLEDLLARVMDERDQLAEDLATRCVGPVEPIVSDNDSRTTMLTAKSGLYRAFRSAITEARNNGTMSVEASEHLGHALNNYIDHIQKHLRSILWERDGFQSRNEELLAQEKRAKQLVSSLGSHNFECVAGPLSLCVEYQELCGLFGIKLEQHEGCLAKSGE